MGNSTLYYATILLVLCASQIISAQLSSTVGTDISISTVSVLLPHDHKVSYVIEAYNGCFKWSLSREGVVDIKELDTCGTKVQIRAASTVSQGRQNVWLLGEHLQSGRLLRCEIYVDHIVKIDILTTTRTMFKEDTEILQIQAFDLEGNLFSSLEGLEYEWSIRADTEATASSAVAQVLKMVRFRESSIEVSESLLRLEDEGKQSSIVLVQGLNTGRARVSSRLTKYVNPFMTGPVPTAQVTIAVREPLLLAPSTTIWVLPGTQIQYTLMSYAKETLKPLDPSTAGLYLWTTSNNQVAEVSQQGLVTAKQVGATRVTAQYVDLEDNNAWSELVVVLPAYLALKITPKQLESSDNKTLSETHSSGSYLISGWEYVVQIEVYDKDGHKIYNIDDLDFNVQLSADYFQVLGKSKNSAQHHVTAVKEGPTEIVVTLEQIRNRYTATQYQPSPPLLTRSDVIITAPVKLTAHDNTRVRHVNLAYHNHVAWLNYYNGKLDSIEPNITNVNVRRVRDVQGWGHEITLTAVGGTGLYEWYSTDQSVVLVRPATHATASNAQLISNNLGRLVAESTGSVTVHASDSRNPINRDHVLVHVSTPHRIEFANSEFECQVDSTLTLSVQLYDQHNVPYDNCSALPFVWEVQDEHVFAPVASTGPVQHCSHRVLRALREGQTTVTVHYMNLRIEVTVFSFKPLRVVWPRDFALVTLGSSAIVLLEGGPNPWTYESSGHTTEALLPQQPNAVAIHKLKANTPYRAYSITCLELGDQDITVEVTNSGSAAHPRPLRVTSKFHFSCQLPQHIFLFPVLEHPNKIDRNDLPLACTEAVSMLPLANHEVTREMLGNFPTKFLTRNNQSIEFEVYLYDRSGRKFTNFTSLNMEWSVTESSGLMSIDLLAANRPRFPYLYTEGSQLIAQLIKDTHSYRHGRLFNLALKEGSVIARVRVVGYDSDTLAASKIQMPYWTASTTEKLTRDIELTLYRNVQAQPPRLSLFNHPHNAVPITALGGSGYFQLNVNDTTVANISYQFGSNVIHVTPLRPGHVKLTLVDLCLTGSEPSFSQIQISDIYAVQLRSRDMVKIGDQIPVLVDLLDMNGQPFDQSQYRFIDTQLLIDSDSIDIAPARAEDLAHMSHDYRTENTWLARGLKLGVARVTARASPRDEKVTNPRYVTGLKTIHVFPPLELHPRPQHVMVVGSQYHIALRGGPPVPSEIVFQVDNTTVALVDKTSGAVTALVEGRTRLRVHCSVWDQTVNRHVIISEDSIELIVGYIQDFKIHADSYVLKTGNEFTFRLTGVLTSYFDHRLHMFEVTPTAWTHLEWMRVKWSVVDPSVLQLLPIYHSANITLDEERSVTVRGRGVGAGRTMVSVRVENVTALIRPRSHVLEPIVASAWVHVSDPLKLLSPAHLFLAPQTSYQLHTNKNNDPKLKYKLLSCVTCGTQQPASATQLTSELHVNARGVITTHNTVGTWLILITERDDAVNPSEGAENSGDDPSSSVLVRVSVRLISSIELVPLVLPPHFPFVYYDLPVGSSMLLQLQARDDLGHVLHAFSPQALHVDSQLSHPQLVALSQHFSSASLLDDASALNTTSDTDRATSRYIIVRGLRPGHALLELRGHSSLPTIAVTASQTSAVLKYHLQIRVSNAIAPLSPTVHVGGTIQFSTSFAQDKALYKNTWSSANEDIVRIDTNTGEAVAVSVGETVVYHNSSVFTWTHVKVVRVARVELESPITSAVQNDELTSDGSQYLMPVVPRDASGAVLEDSAAIKHHLLIKCSLTSALQMQNVFVRNFTNPQTLQHYCIVKPFATKHDKISEPITVRAVVSDAAQTASVSADKQFTLFTSFKILAPRELFLTRNANVQLEVQSKKELSVRNTNPELISIRRIGVDAATHTWTYELKAVDPSVSVRRLPIEFLDLDSGQAEHIFVTSRSSSGADVLVIDDKGRASSSSMAWWLAILIGTATVVLAYLWSMNNNTPAPAPRPVNRVANTPYLNSGSDAAFNPITSPTRSFSPSRGSSDYSHFITSPSQRK